MLDTDALLPPAPASRMKVKLLAGVAGIGVGEPTEALSISKPRSYTP